MIHPYLWIVIVGGITSFLVACGNGANDLSNAFGTTYGSRVLTLLQIIVLATLCEFAGAAGLGSSVTATMSSGIARADTFANDPYVLMYGFLSALVATAIWLIVATWKDLSVSSHQSIAGGIIGFALVYGGGGAVIWAGKSSKFPFVTGVVPIILSWIISPLLTGLVAVAIYCAVRYALLQRDYSVRLAPRCFPFIAGLTVFLEFLFIFLIAAESRLGWSMGRAAWVAAVIGAGVGLLCIFLVPLVRMRVAMLERQAVRRAMERKISVVLAMRELLAGGQPLTHRPQHGAGTTTTPASAIGEAGKVIFTATEQEPAAAAAVVTTTASNGHAAATLGNSNGSNNAGVTREEREGRDQKTTARQAVELRRVGTNGATGKTLDSPRAAEGAVVVVRDEESESEEEEEEEEGCYSAREARPAGTAPHRHPFDQHHDVSNGMNSVAPDEAEAGATAVVFSSTETSEPLKAEPYVELDEDGVRLFDPRAEYIFRFLQVFTAACMSLAHGANDVSNAIGPFSAIYDIYVHTKVEASAKVPIWLLCMGGAGIVVGLATYGQKIMRLLGEKLALVTPARGYAAELATALVVSFATIFGIPISSTHCITGAVIAISMVDVGVRAVRWNMVARLYLGWILTLFVTGLISAAIFAQGINSPSRA